MIMRYLTVDGMFSGTGIRDSVEGGYVRPEDLGLSTELSKKIGSWLERYADAHYNQYKDSTLVSKLDSEGIEICGLIASEIVESKVDYYSSAKTKKLPSCC